MAVDAIRDVLSRIRAKSARPGEGAGESLTDHTAAVVGRLGELYARFPGLAGLVGEPRLWHRVFWACVLHDLGKIARGFQAQLGEKGRPWGQRHEILSLAFLEWVLPDDRYGDHAWVAAGVASHHRDLDDIIRLYPPADDPADDPVVRLIEEVDDPIVEALASWLVVEPPEWVRRCNLPGVEASPRPLEQPSNDFRRHGAARIHRALAAYRRLTRTLREEPASSPANRAALALRGLVLMADHTASAHLPPAQPALQRVEEIVHLLRFGPLEALHPHQREAAAVAGHALLVAPTGSGKTEAALLWAARQKARDASAGRVFYLLPYQASLNAMHARLSRLFPDAVALQHSRAVQALYRNLLESKQYTPERAAAEARREQALARLHHYPVRVLTPYQLLRGAFRLKGYEALLTDASNGLFVFDEVHAYEPQRLGMIVGMMAHLRRHLGGRFLVMSATFPNVLREALHDALGEAAGIEAGRDLYKAFARHTLRLVDGTITDPHVLDLIARRARSGESVLVVCNTVGTAATVGGLLRERLAEAGVTVDLLHGRFNARDRFSKERRLLDRLGTRNRNRTAAPALLVATQVVEVSLDVDFDTLFTEPAPLESLVQRFGRVNRGRSRPSRDVHVLKAPRNGQRIYVDEYVTGALRTLAPHDGELIDESCIGPWVDAIYAGPVGDAWRQEVKHWRDQFAAACLDDLRAFQSSPELAEAFERMFDGTEVLPSGLAAEYARLAEEEPLRASELLVPISPPQLKRLWHAGKVMRRDREDPVVVDVPYDAERGLDL